ncbi:unnamed protein product, partial [Nippostrongylus brasiliensis]|uniref:DUF1758 domain-containing protein n=1 Tax=Nippostrongylus brasiliensis TaxID=27835 RepID=A0A0N4Y8W5_NIPBR
SYPRGRQICILANFEAVSSFGASAKRCKLSGIRLSSFGASTNGSAVFISRPGILISTKEQPDQASIMEAQVSILKRKLTMLCKKLQARVSEAQDEETEQDSGSTQEVLTALGNGIKRVEEAQEEYANRLDKSGSTPSPEEQSDFENYLTMAEQTLSIAFDCVDRIQARLMDLLDSLEKHITCQERITQYTSNNRTTSSQQPAREEGPARGRPLRTLPPCMYCGQQHRAVLCTRYTTPQQRATYLREHRLCMICASAQHTTEECKRRNCFACQGRHHTSCCFKAKVAPASQDTAPTLPQRKDKPPTPAAQVKSKTRDHPRPTQQPVKQFATHHHESEVEHDSEEDLESIAEYHSSRQLLGIGESYLPMGELTILDPSTRQLRKVAALLDSGAECSFIDQQLAEELNLPVVNTTTLRLRTFGAEQHLEVNTRRVPLEVWDSNGSPYQLQLLTHTTLTNSLRTPPILPEDAEFIKENGLNINVVRARKAKPKILLGSDQLWQLMTTDSTSIRLPSGLYLLPTRLGHLLTGQLQLQQQTKATGSTDEVNGKDSEIALEWVTAQNYLQATPYVRNRVSEIRKVIAHLEEKHCQVQLGHVPTQENSADLATRGIDKIGFHDHPWWNGPAFLSQPKEKWVSAYRYIPIQEVPGEDGRCDIDPKQVALVAPNPETSPHTTTTYTDIFSDVKKSDLGSIRRIVAYVLREQHVRDATKGRGSRLQPNVGQVVLICEALQPRHSWKMGRIEELHHDSEGKVREALVTLPSRRKIRRPEEAPNQTMEKATLSKNSGSSNQQRTTHELEEQQEAQRHQREEVEHLEERDRVDDKEHGVEHQHEENAVRAPQPDDGDPQSIRREIRRLEREISEIEEARRAIPARAHADLSRGIHPTMRCVFCERQGQHYSDACPIVTDVDDRRRIIERRRRCFRCLEHGERRGFCDYQEKRCIYCNRAARTVLREARRENGEHHAAICFVSIHREQAWIYEEQLRDRVAELEQRLRQH